MTQADPPLTDTRTLRWAMPDDHARPVSYATVDRTAEDVARNKFFAIAIFLGTAAACLVAAMQSVLNRR